MAEDPQPVLYTATAVNRTGPDGVSLTDTGWHVAVQSPVSATGPAALEQADRTTNPEELLALAWATCLSGSARVVAPGRDVTVRVEVALHGDATGSGFAFTPTAFVSFADTDAEAADRLAASAHARCPISKLLSGRGTATVVAVPHSPDSPA
ncbi:Organic hydroperoxide reductase OsmC/OhrA [Brevibacterium jeotgali]|uniref:Organic hydroperoxide reductase OsmC/OhrA n=1 Tax=Brevibacterium jeotgali TaxID=1262550 RepID=A0A2H1L5E4_9MICO|nr:OsmC family protein [Brevibacterium jeotgali]SMY12116.1 Organic hydroperoxide reductase OsmC/OhrA [Brevibacterium jeotgali]